MKVENVVMLHTRQQMLEMERLSEQRRLEEEAWLRQQDLLLAAEEQRRTLVQQEDQKLADQRARLAAMKRETKIKELKTLDDARRRYLLQQQAVKETEIRKMDQEIQRKVAHDVCPHTHVHLPSSWYEYICSQQ